MPTSHRQDDIERRFEKFEERLAELYGGANGIGQVWWELWDLTKRVLALERPKQRRSSRRKSSRRKTKK